MFDVVQYRHTKGAFGFALLLLVGVLLAPFNKAQAQECSFSDEGAVADTLDPAGYLPFEVGIIREYVSWSGPIVASLSRGEVLADTLIDGEVFYKSLNIFYEAGAVEFITRADTSFSYWGVIDGGLVRWTPESGREETGIEFFHDFNTCYTHEARGDNTIEVGGGYDSTYTFEFSSGETVELAARKKYSFIATQAGSEREYGYGLGALGSRGEPDLRSELTYARIGDQEYGTPLDSLFDIRVTAAESRPDLANATRLEIYPNPSTGSTHLSVELVEPGPVVVRTYDILGRVIATPMRETYLPMGVHEVVWSDDSVAPGVYVARVTSGGHPVARSRFVIMR